MDNARTEQFDAYMAGLQKKRISPLMGQGLMVVSLGLIAFIAAMLAWLTFGQAPVPVPQPMFNKTVAVAAPAGARVPVYMLSRETESLRAATEASLARQRELVYPDYEPANMNIGQDTLTFSSSLVREVVAEEVDSFLFRLELIGRVGEFVVGRANHNQKPVCPAGRNC